MAEFTLLELHLDGAEFTANAPFSSADDESESTSRWSRRSETTSETDDDSSSSSKWGLLAVLGIGALAVGAVAVSRFLGGSDEA
ncbi:MAG: hypothetical protein ABEH86_12685 [Haloarcula sp.]